MATQKRVFKATRKISGGQKSFRKWTEWDIGDVLIGKYVDTHRDQYEHDCPVVEVIEAQFKDKSGSKYEGKNLVLNASGMLNKAMEKATYGQVVQVTYNGTSTIEKGKFAGKDSHTMEIQLGELEEEQEVEL